MNDVLKQRLVGALVIIVFGVLFWPMIFSDPNQLNLDRNSQVPSIPSLKQMQLQAPVPVAGLDPAGGRYDAALAAEARELEREAATEIAKPPPKPASAIAKPGVDERGIPVAWVLQVVTVSKKGKAEELVRELVTQDYKAYFRPIERGGETLYRVNVGPRFERKAIEKSKTQIDKELRVNSIIARYVP